MPSMTAEQVQALTPEKLQQLARTLTPREPCMTTGHWYGPPYSLSVKQQVFLTMSCREALYGGAAGGGKSDALLRGALQYVCVPGYAALLVRQTYPQLAMEGGLIERAQDWLAGTDAQWRKSENRWVFPAGSSLTFMHMEHEDDRFKIAGAEFQFAGFDELTNWQKDKVYRFASSRLRRPKPTPERPLPACPTCGLTLADVPLRLRAGTNPGSRGEAWVNARFVQPWAEWKAGNAPPPSDKKFLPAYLHDNPGLDQDGYLESLGVLDAMTYAQLKDGSWGLRQSVMIHREKIAVVQDWPRDAQLVRSWDFAATEQDDANDPDWTVGALVALKDGRWWLVDVQRARLNPGGVEQLFLQTLVLDAHQYGRAVTTVIEQEPGSSGKMNVAHMQKLGTGHAVYAQPATGSKVDRARPLAAAVDNGNFAVVAGAWNETWLDEAAAFPDACPHDDQVDAVTGAIMWLAKATGRGGMRYSG